MELIKCFKALSDQTRLRLLYLLKQFELNVNEIVVVVDMIQSGVSRHLKILMESGLLASRRDGSFIYYSAAKNDTVKTFTALIEQSLEKQNILNEDLRRARQIIQIRQNKTKRFFKTIAPEWDQIKKRVLGDFDLNPIIIKKISLQGNISDLGCGTGELIEQLSNSTSHNLIGIDSSPEMLEQARSRLSGLKNAELRLGELEHLPMKNREITTAVMNMVLHHISQPELSIGEVYRVLKPGGIFILSDFEKHDQEKIKEIMGGSWLGFEKKEVCGWLEEAGFQLLTTDYYHVKYGLTINFFTAQKVNNKEKS